VDKSKDWQHYKSVNLPDSYDRFFDNAAATIDKVSQVPFVPDFVGRVALRFLLATRVMLTDTTVPKESPSPLSESIRDAETQVLDEVRKIIDTEMDRIAGEQNPSL
jgi:hypothetical protein